MTSYILTRYLRKFGEKGCNATVNELQQMGTREVFGEVDQNSLTAEQKRKALPVLPFLTLRHNDSVIRGRACADRFP